MFRAITLWSALIGLAAADSSVLSTVKTSVDVFLSKMDFPISNYSATFLQCVDASNQAAYQSLVLYESSFPAISFENNVTKEFGVVKVSEASSLSPENITTLTAIVNQYVATGSCITELLYESTIGNFYTYAVVRQSEVAFEALQFFVPELEKIIEHDDDDNVGRALRARRLNMQRQYETTVQSGPLIWTHLWFINVMEFNCFATADCLDLAVVSNGCTGTHVANGLELLWDGKGLDDVKKVGDSCCRNRCEFGWSYGFASVKYSSGSKTTIEVEGGLGCAGTFSDTAKACCYLDSPSSSPSSPPSSPPSIPPSSTPTNTPTGTPSSLPSISPTGTPSSRPSILPTGTPSSRPSILPTGAPSSRPSISPTVTPTSPPTNTPTQAPTPRTTTNPTSAPSSIPTRAPISGITEPPVQAPLPPPIEPPIQAPVPQPVAPPSPPPVEPPIQAPVPAPVQALVQEPLSPPPLPPPVEHPAQTPVQQPVEASSPPSVEPPAQAPVQAPVQQPLSPPPSPPPVEPPIQAPVQQSVAPPSPPPAKPPVQAPVQAPIQQPVTPPSPPPVESNVESPVSSPVQLSVENSGPAGRIWW